MSDFASRREMMVDTQIRPSDVTKFPIIDSMLRVERENFVPANRRETAYMGENVDLGGNRVVLEPRTLAKMLDALDVGPGDLVLDIGAGLGYSSVVLSRIAQAVIALESEAAWRSEAETGAAEAGADNVIVVEGDLTAGAPQHGPYEAILIQGGVEVVPDAILSQLKDGGRIAALFVEGALGVCRIGHAIDGGITWRDAFHAGAPVIPGFERAPAFTL